MKPKYEARVFIKPPSFGEQEICTAIAKRRGFHWETSGGVCLRRADNDLAALTEAADNLRADLKLSRIDVRRIKIVETILDVEAD